MTYEAIVWLQWGNAWFVTMLPFALLLLLPEYLMAFLPIRHCEEKTRCSID